MFWNFFPYFAIASVLLWVAGAFFAWKSRPRAAISLTAAGLLVFFSTISSVLSS